MLLRKHMCSSIQVDLAKDGGATNPPISSPISRAKAMVR